MKKNNFSLNLIVNGKPIHEYEHKGNIFVEGRKDSEFVIEFVNDTYRRVLAIPSVDGLSPIDGSTASPDSMGYIVEPFSTLTIPGWCIDENNVANFKFMDKEKSYSKLQGSARDYQAGVIGMLVYGEHVDYEPATRRITKGYDSIYPKPKFWPSEKIEGFPKDWWLSQNTPNTLSALSSVTVSQSNFEYGVGWGSEHEFKVETETFDRGELLETFVVYYDSRRNLEKRGIQVVKKDTTYLDDLPVPFRGIGCPRPNFSS